MLICFRLFLLAVAATARFTPGHKPPGPQSLYPLNNVADDKLKGQPVKGSGIADTAPKPANAPKADACGQISRLVDKNNHVPITAAWDCLQSVPFYPEDSLEFVQSIRPYLDWQSTYAYLKNPPKGYPYPPSDFFADFDKLEERTKAKQYKNDYDFEFDLYRIFQKNYDGHFRIFPHMIELFSFRRGISLVSVSYDGKSLPKPYVHSDIAYSFVAKSFKPSAVTKINGEDAVAYLKTLSDKGGLQDPDANYNNNFFTLAALAKNIGPGNGAFYGFGRGAYNYPGPNTTLTFENGTTRTFQHFAVVNKDFGKIKNAEDLYNTYIFLPEYIPQQEPDDPLLSPPVGYPKPVIRAETNFIGGYYIDNPKYKDVAVLSLPSFKGSNKSFQQAGVDFILRSKKDGKKKLVIDVSMNNGGYLFDGYNLFLELFPKIFPYGGTRYRAFESYNIIGDLVSNKSGPVYPPQSKIINGANIQDFAGLPFNYRADVDAKYKPFPSWKAKYGPDTIHGDQFTPIIRWNISDLYQTGFDMAVYGDQRKNVVKETSYNASDIIVVTDGFCASTCTLLLEFLRTQAGVKTIAFGGRPQEGIIQAVGGVKGANDYLWETIYNIVNATFTISDKAEAARLSKGPLGKYSTLPFRRSNSTLNAVNVRNAYTEKDQETPQQFVYQAADCRLYYAPENFVRVSSIWEAAADAAWGGKPCAAGKLSEPSGPHGAAADASPAGGSAADGSANKPTISEEEANGFISALQGDYSGQDGDGNSFS